MQEKVNRKEPGRQREGVRRTGASFKETGTHTTHRPVGQGEGVHDEPVRRKFQP